MPTPRAIDEPGPLDVRESIIRGALERIAGIRVGRVVTWYPDQTADVQPLRRRRFFSGRGRTGTVVDEPIVPRVPVGWWRFGKMLLAGELEAGDDVLLVGLAREFRPWWLGGQAFDPSSEAMHSARDVMALPWLSSLARPMVARAARTFYLGREDGTASVSIPMDVPARIVIEAGPAGIVLGSDATDLAILGTTLAATVGSPAAPASIAGILNVVPAAVDPATVITLANANKTAILAICAAINAALATKTVVE